jgi:CheY-like chemotaxis protein
VDGDSARLKQALSNLIHNAARYTPNNGSIRVIVSIKAHTASVTVSDNGIGIAPEMLPRVFDLFTQADNEVARKNTGLGIGLTVVHRLVRDHGGAVSARSGGPGLGSQFTVTLPLREAPPQEVGGAPTAARPERAPDRKVLLIDDNRDAVSAVDQLLTLHGYECRSAFDGKAGVAITREWRPHAAVIDIGLPRMDGFLVARALRSQVPACDGHAGTLAHHRADVELLDKPLATREADAHTLAGSKAVGQG